MKSDARPPLLPVTEQMKAWSAALAAELSDHPGIRLKSFFGFTALYRGRIMFGLLPRTRNIFQENAVAFRFHRTSSPMRSRLHKDPRIAAFDKDKARWFIFQLSSDRDLHDALDYLARAFEAAGKAKRTK